jgi:DNA-binding MarR family transcriptional regulator
MSNVESSVSEAQAIMDSLRRIVQALRRASTQYEGLTSAQTFVLRMIASREGASVNDVAALTHTHQSTASEMIARLEASGLLERRIAADDRRRVELYLTEAGRSAIRNQTRTPQENLIEALATMQDGKRTALAEGLRALTHAAGLDEAIPPLFFEGKDE